VLELNSNSLYFIVIAVDFETLRMFTLEQQFCGRCFLSVNFLASIDIFVCETSCHGCIGDNAISSCASFSYCYEIAFVNFLLNKYRICLDWMTDIEETSNQR